MPFARMLFRSLSALARTEKAPWLFLVEGQKNRAPGLRVLPQLITQTPDLRPSPEILQIYGQTPKGEQT